MKKILLVVLLLFFMLCFKAQNHSISAVAEVLLPSVEVQSIEISI